MAKKLDHRDAYLDWEEEWDAKMVISPNSTTLQPIQQQQMGLS